MNNEWSLKGTKQKPNAKDEDKHHIYASESQTRR
jgi:hypothetical protein